MKTTLGFMMTVGFVVATLSDARAITYDERNAQKFHQMLSECGNPSPKGGSRDGTAGCFQKLPAKLFDGTSIIAENREQFMEANAHIRKYKRQLNTVISKWNGTAKLRRRG